MGENMAPKVSDRIASLNDSLTERSEQGLAHLSANNLDSARSSVREIDTELVELIRTNRKLGEAVIIGVTRFVPWNRETERAFQALALSLSLSLGTSSFLSVVPWKLLGQASVTDLITLDAQESRLDPTLVSRILREIPGWKKHKSFVLLDIGRLNSEMAQLLATWCELNILLTQGSLTELSNDSRDIRKWRAEGYPLNAAIHVA